MPITDLADYGLELPVDSEAYNSVGGFVFGELGRLPKRGDMVRANGYSLRVESVRENRVDAVRIRDHEAVRARAGPPAAAPGGGGGVHAAAPRAPGVAAGRAGQAGVRRFRP